MALLETDIFTTDEIRHLDKEGNNKWIKLQRHKDIIFEESCSLSAEIKMLKQQNKKLESKKAEDMEQIERYEEEISGLKSKIEWLGNALEAEKRHWQSEIKMRILKWCRDCKNDCSKCEANQYLKYFKEII